MANKEKVKDIVRSLMEQLYDAKGFNNFNYNPLERNIFEEEMKDLWAELEYHVVLFTDERADYENTIEDLEDQVGELASRNEDLAEENTSLKDRLDKISEVVNSTWS